MQNEVRSILDELDALCSEKDKENIANMEEDSFKYCEYEESLSSDVVNAFMKLEDLNTLTGDK